MNMNLIQTLGVEVGVRPAGSEQAATAVRRIAEAFKEFGLSPRVQEFEFTGYEPEEPTLEIDGRRWAAGPCVYSPATGSEGLSGTVRVLGSVESGGGTRSPVFSIEDPEHRELARIHVNSRGGAIPSVPRMAPRLGGPAVWIGRDDGELLAGLEHPQARLHTAGESLPGQRDANIIARLEGESPEAIVVCAHFDSVWRGPGVVDNASGVEGMFRVLERLAASGPHARSLIFCAFAAEELGLLGSYFFVNEAKLRGELDDIAGVVNLDCIAHGTTLEVMAGPEELQGRSRAIVQQLGLGQRYPVNVTPPQPGSDHVPFAQEGIPSVAITYYPYPEYHSPDERPELIDEVRLADAVDIALALVESQLDAPAARVPHM
jgi:hypothetical protein